MEKGTPIFTIGQYPLYEMDVKRGTFAFQAIVLIIALLANIKTLTKK